MSHYQATADQLIEAEIWVACVDGIRNWTEPERQWIATQYDFEHNLIEWWLSDASEGCFTPTNAEFMRQRAREYPWFQEETTQMTKKPALTVWTAPALTLSQPTNKRFRRLLNDDKTHWILRRSRCFPSRCSHP